MYGWMDGCMEARMCEWLDVWMCGCMDLWMFKYSRMDQNPDARTVVGWARVEGRMRKHFVCVSRVWRHSGSPVFANFEHFDFTKRIFLFFFNVFFA